MTVSLKPDPHGSGGRDDLVVSVQRETFVIRNLEDFKDVHRVGVAGSVVHFPDLGHPEGGVPVTASIHLLSVRLELTKSGRRREIPMNDDEYRPWSAWIRRLAVGSSDPLYPDRL